MSEKRFWWLKLQSDFFNSKRIKKLRKISGGDTFTIIYLKMQLLSLKDGGVLTYTGLEKSFAEELALDLDEDPDNVSITLSYLASCGLIETSDDISYFLPYVHDNTLSETSAAQRMRDKRQQAKIEQCSNNVQKCSNNSELGYVEIDIEKEKELEIEKDIEIDTEKDIEKDIELEKETSLALSEPPADVEPLILNDGAEWYPTQALLREYIRLYPNVDVKQQFRSMRAWCVSNPTRRKTIRGIKRFVGAWLDKEQNRSGNKRDRLGAVDAWVEKYKEDPSG